MVNRIILFILIVISILFLTLTSVISPSFAQSKNSQTIILPQTQTINQDYFATGSNVTISGTVNGDAYIVGGNITVDGIINGDLIGAGGNINISGKVNGSIRMIGGNINISGTTEKNISLIGGTISLLEPGQTMGNMIAAGGNVNILAPVNGNVSVTAGQTQVSSLIEKDVNADIGTLTLTPSAKISGNLNYSSQNQAQVEPGAKVLGKINFNQTQQSPSSNITGRISSILKGISVTFTILSFITSIMLGILMLQLFPNFMDQTTKLIAQNPGKTFGIGLLSFIIFPLLFTVLLVTIVGIPIAILSAVILAIVSYLGKIFVGIVIGKLTLDYLYKKPLNNGYYLITGLVIYYLIQFIPIIGLLMGLVTIMLGLGAVLIEEFNYYHRIHY